MNAPQPAGGPKVRPILFSLPMTRALLEGRKTQTRRIANTFESPASSTRHFVQLFRDRSIETDARAIPYCPYGQPGDLLWCREPWQSLTEFDGLQPCDIPNDSDVLYIADREDSLWDARRRHAKFMPRWASRLTLELTEVRIQRLQDISEADAVAEGVEPVLDGVGQSCGWLNYEHHEPGTGYYLEARNSFFSLWDSLHGEGSWDENPFVWALSFRVHQQNVDALLAERAAA